MFGSVAGTVDANYDNDWLLDGRSGRPVRRASGGLSLTATALASRSVSILALINHNISGAVGISGGVTATIPAATLGADGIYLNPFVAISPVAASSLVMAASGTPAVVGELWAGTKRILGRQLRTEVTFEESDPFEWEGECSTLAPYDPGLADARRIVGEAILDDDGLDDVREWYQSTRRGTRPTLIVPIDTINDAWLVVFRYSVQTVLIHKTDRSRSIHRVSFEFTELPRVRW